MLFIKFAPFAIASLVAAEPVAAKHKVVSRADPSLPSGVPVR